MNEIRTVIKFTFLSRLRARSFAVMTIIFALILSVMINLPAILSHFSSHAPIPVGVVDRPAGIAAKLDEYFAQEGGDSSVRIVILKDLGTPEANERQARRSMSEGTIKGVMEFGEPDASGFPAVVYKAEDTSDSALKAKLQGALQSIKMQQTVRELGLDPGQLARLNAPVAWSTVQLNASGDRGKSESEMAAASVLVYALLFLLYVGVIGFGNMVATEITSEKNTRVMEVLISSVPPLRQMFGKIIGICLVGLVQILIIVAVALANLQLPHNRGALANLDLGQLKISLILYFLVFYVGGYLIYATLFAAVGSLVSRTEDVGQATMPITFLIVAAFMIAMFGLQHPNAPFVVVMSFIPLFSPLIMFLRIGMSEPPFWEVALSIVFLFVSIGGIGWIAAKIYRTGVLMYGKRPTLKELRKAMKAYKV
jgi:ABC-2 type transport system permease protein